MTKRRLYHSLRFKIMAGVLLSLLMVLTVTSCLRYISYRRQLVEILQRSGLDSTDLLATYLADYLSSRVLLTVLAVLVTVLVVYVMMSRVVLGRLSRFLGVVNEVRRGNLDERVAVEYRDEIAELAQAFNRMADGLVEKERLEQEVKERTRQLQVQADRLSALNSLALTVTQSLDLRQVLRSALEEMLDLFNLRACWIVLRNGLGERLGPIASRGLPERVALAHVQCSWARSFSSAVLAAGRPAVFPYTKEHSCPAAAYFRQEDRPRTFSDSPAGACPADNYFRREGLIVRACVPLRSKNQTLGIMTLVGDAGDPAQHLGDDALAMLTAIGRQIGIAVENASLYEELRREEALRRQLLERVITVQEEERKRIARELHDQTGQPLTSLIMTLRAIGRMQSMEEVRASLGDLRSTAAEAVKRVRDLALELRPAVLDDLGLLAALRHYLREYQDRLRLPVDFQVLGLDNERLPPGMETALYRIAQEALSNVARHSQAHSVSVLLERRDTSVVLIVEDDGMGFDVGELMGRPPYEGNLGLLGMRERASLVGGTLTIESTPGTGTAVFAEVPLLRGAESEGKEDPFAGC